MLRRVALLAALLSACATGAGAAEGVAEHDFALRAVYPGITFTPDHLDVALSTPGAPGNGELLVFLGNIGNGPQSYGRLLHVAVEDGGYHALGLDWVSGLETDARGTNIFYQCTDPDGACFAPVWQEAFDGSDVSPRVRIGITDSVLNRLTKALAYLDKTYPGEGWGAFLSNGAPVWNRIALAGQSNGAGEAAYIASRFAVVRVALFSGPMDSTGNSPNLMAASWLAGPHATPAARWYAFASEQDVSRRLNRTERYLVAWSALGLGRPVRIDGLTPPFAGAHALTTSATPCDGCNAQDMVSKDKTPLDAAGSPIFRPVWDDMLGMPIASGGP